jgi:hypothetical protein
VLPAITIAFAISFLALKGVYTFLFTDDLGISMAPIPEKKAVIEAIILGLIIPLLSSILPIKAILTKTLTDALDY